MAKKDAGKQLAPGSIWDRFDTDGDGTITDEEIARGKEMLELELREEKSDAQRKMAWIAMIMMIGHPHWPTASHLADCPAFGHGQFRKRRLLKVPPYIYAVCMTI